MIRPIPYSVNPIPYIAQHLGVAVKSVEVWAGVFFVRLMSGRVRFVSRRQVEAIVQAEKQAAHDADRARRNANPEKFRPTWRGFDGDYYVAPDGNFWVFDFQKGWFRPDANQLKKLVKQTNY